ncbi:hypothetical protein [Paludibacterium denitrificans]|uniref:hypothetical protein n=1 Tax=Paludibacterium denitrificans TaxID=2675226 RepID=UPI001E3B8E0A|nr:hypothetical protein [Paludibacterium denitrificans]
MTTSLTDLLQQAEDRRAGLIAALEAEDTNIYRLFHGSVEGHPGLTVDRYGDLLLVQSFHHTLPDDELLELSNYYQRRHPELELIYNDRGGNNSRIRNPLTAERQERAELPRIAKEMGISYHIQARHDGQDPWLFLDLRAARRRVRELAAGKSRYSTCLPTPAASGWRQPRAARSSCSTSTLPNPARPWAAPTPNSTA